MAIHQICKILFSALATTSAVSIIGSAAAEEHGPGEIYRFYSRASGYILTAQGRPSLQTYDDYDLTGVELRVLQGVDLQACAANCQADNQCQAYSFDKWNSRCSLKASLSLRRFEPSSVSGVAANAELPPESNAPWSMQRFRERSFSGTPSHSEAMPTYDQCEQACQDDQKCVALSYSNKELTCGLFEAIGGYSTDPGTDSGIKHQTAEDKFNALPQATPSAKATQPLPEPQPPSNLADLNCDQLWHQRNSIYKDAGYCFHTPRAIRIFGNAGCVYSNDSDVPLSSQTRQVIGEIQESERMKGCLR